MVEFRAIKNPVGVGETYGVRREETICTWFYVQYRIKVLLEP
jgi:hypothetical protein